MGLSDYAQLAEDFLFPKRCVFCGKVIRLSEDVCADCAQSAERVTKPVCAFCGLPKTHCDCSKTRHFYDGIAAPFVYNDTVRKGVLLYKNGMNKRAVSYIAREMALCYRQNCPFAADLIAHVPLTVREKRRRGFDQNREIAAALAAYLQIPLYEGLCKIYDTPAQKSRGRLYKRGNVAGVFDAIDPEEVRGKRILLTDDVKTSGSTLDECAKMLKLYDAEAVFALSFAIAGQKKPQKEKSKSEPDTAK